MVDAGGERGGGDHEPVGHAPCAQDPTGRDAAISGGRSVDPLAEFRTRLASLPKQNA